MEQYGKVVEVFLNAVDLLAFIWGPMKFILEVYAPFIPLNPEAVLTTLQTASNFSESLNSILDAYFELGVLIPQLSQYQAHCVSNEYMRTVLAQMYKDILEFHEYAMKYFQKPVWKQVFQATWIGFKLKLDELKNKMRHHGRLVESQASIVQFEEGQKLRSLAEINFREIREKDLRQRREDVKRWLSPYNSRLQHGICVKAKAECSGSGKWLVADDRFKAWFDPNYCKTPLLWLNGIPGAGKTVLASTIIDAVQDLTEKYDARLIYFYCKGATDTRNSFVAVESGLLSQLLATDENVMLQLYD